MNVALEIHRIWVNECIHILNAEGFNIFADKLKSTFKELEQEVNRKTIELEPEGMILR